MLDRTRTPLGARALREALTRPSTDPLELEARWDAVEELVARPVEREDLQPVAGRDEHRLPDAGSGLDLLEPGADLLQPDGHPLAHRDGRFLVREADADQRHAPVPCSAGAAESRPT